MGVQGCARFFMPTPGREEGTRPAGRGNAGARGYAAGVIGSMDSPDDGPGRSMPYSLILVRRVL